MPTSLVSNRKPRVQKICTLFTHEEKVSSEPVLINLDKFADLSLTPGCLIQIVALANGPRVRDFQTTANSQHNDASSSNYDSLSKDGLAQFNTRRSRRGSVVTTIDDNGKVVEEQRDVDPTKSYIFLAKPLPAEVKAKEPQFQISMVESVAKVFGFRNRMQVMVTEVDEEDHSASHVEITFRDEYLARADMWRLAISELSNRTVYRGQRLLFIGTIKATVKNVYMNGKSMHSGYFAPTTKPIFRSESARFVLFIQMSKEMWDFDAEGGGEIMFNKVVNGFLPELFKRWMKINARHLVTIILFTRMEYDGDSILDGSSNPRGGAGFQNHCHRFRDYYRVVVSDMASGDWVKILYRLKKEFRAFLRDVSLVPAFTGKPADDDSDTGQSGNPDFVISGKPCTAAQGNILEAINLASAQFAKDYIDRDLVRTGISVVVVTAGTGVFEVDYNMLKLTTDTLIGSGIGIDLVCLSRMPLHSVPLFKYKTPRTVSEAANGESTGHRDATEARILAEQEKTLRQFGGRIPSVSVYSPVSEPPVIPQQQLILSAENAEEWQYAMPHWVDISFWSGPADEIVELVNPARSVTSKMKPRDKRRTFALRCRMYELQMMGVLENELGGISIPYMEEEPYYPLQLTELLEANTPGLNMLSEKAEANLVMTSADSLHKLDSSEHQKADAETLQSNWMDWYDEQAFIGPRYLPGPPVGTSQVGLYDKSGSPERVPSETLLSASYRSSRHTLGQNSHPTFEGVFHKTAPDKGKHGWSGSPNSGHGPGECEEQAVRADVLHRQATVAKYQRRRNEGSSSHSQRSMHSSPRDSPSPSRASSPPKRGDLTPRPASLAVPAKAEPASKRGGWFLRNISFGRTGPAAKSTPTVAASNTTMTEVEHKRISIGVKQKGVIAEKLASTRMPEVGSPSQPIAIKPSSRSGTLSVGSENGRSVETVKAAPLAATPLRGSLTRDPGSTFLLAGSRALTESLAPKLDLSTSAGAQNVPRTLSPTSAIAPWAVLVNPCNPKKNPANVASQFRRWQHVFPKRLKTASVKWKSLCSPAAVPLTNEYFPTPEQLATEYNESPYKIAQNEDDDGPDVLKSRETLVRELIAFRLSHGFQIIVGTAVSKITGGRDRDMSQILHSDYMTKDGDTVFMSVGNTIHQLVCVDGGEVEVKRFTRKPTTALESSAGIDAGFPYRPYIRTAFEDGYQCRNVVLRYPRREFNWNFIDTFLAGYHDEFSDNLRFWRARFVLIPVESPALNRRALPMMSEDSEEEIRLEGIRKLTQLWQRYRFIPPEERHFQATRKQKDPNPLAIEYHTRDTSAIVAAGQDNAMLNEVDNEFQSSIFSETEQYHTSSIDLKRLADDLQGERGIPMLDRRWHWKLHYNCFRGIELTSWLLLRFEDLHTRDEAVDLGNQLMNKGLFHHVQKRHQFRDGNFFFQIAPEYRAPRPDARTAWFGSTIRKPDKSVPSTPSVEGPRSSPLAGRSTKSRSNTTDSSETFDSPKEGDKTPTRANTPKRKVMLSRVMRYDVDARRRSYRPEIISLHYDRLHNPDNCYHIRIDWMNVTAKLIEDAVVTWATSVEKYGLKLVEVPIAEAANIVDHHPFRSPYSVKLAVPPPRALPERTWDASNFSPQPKTDRFAYQKALLRRLNFVLDMEAASAFPPDVDVSYSWGKPDYKYTQFIHRSGLVIAQIASDSEFLLLANRLAHNRAKDTTKFRPTDPYDYKRATASSTNPSTPAIDKIMRSPFASPLVRPVQDGSLLQSVFHERSISSLAVNTKGPQTAEQVKDEFEAFCTDPMRLRQFYEQAFQQTPDPSPRMVPVPDSSIPTLGLPPAISVREASPAAAGVWPAPTTSAGSLTARIEAPSSIARRQDYEGIGIGISGINTGGNGGGSKRDSSDSTIFRRRGSHSSGDTLCHD
ncbi:hypothetical protein M011DRAFT_418572 [Sporormia fimetaria CBS 119925]|uniref:Vacuolar membrane-associated protein IML1 n=1 Tax=Sporormia fimetaria CBS 119925 TaxID=1340428 RepID=A0A6A6VL50_9PLEO|nr:hypothetical protein M011DRAFT_418572 [Sporormia fimetaria CBS 119925]